MTMLVCYPSKKSLKASVGKALVYRETSVFGPEFKADDKFTVAYRPSLWKHAEGGREFFAVVHMENGLIKKVE